MSDMTVARVWEESLVIPTYEVGAPEKVPMFLEKRAYQGSTGKIYPLAVTEVLSEEAKDVTYNAVYLENDYLLVMILPELGGRIQRAYDKTNGYDFVYYNEVIKPALIGLAGPWISGGIEFNWPQHHRPTTYSPVDHRISENADGSCTVYLGELDRMYGTKGMAAITLYPDKAYIEIKGQVFNNTELPQTFLWWANPAIPVNNYTYSVFPPDVNAVMDHGKRAVSTFPIATGEYYKYDYSAGVDISRFKNVVVPTSYMAASSDYDFIGNYDERIDAGLLHVADHHISPGKKQWTWGNGDFGQTWYDNLTDANGPYIELMTGVYTDNQPDFTWLKPHEEKNFVQYFMPYKGVGRVGNASKEAMVSLDISEDGGLVIKAYATSVFDSATIEIMAQGDVIYRRDTSLSPTDYFMDTFAYKGRIEDCTVIVTSGTETLVSYKVYEKAIQPLPKPAEKLPRPNELGSLEELYLAALHLEQYRHATYEPADYYLEGLKRDATDIRLNNGYGLLLLRRGRFEESIPYFKKAIEKHTWKNPNPYVGEYHFNLGLASFYSGNEDDAYDAFFKATWSAEMQNAGYYWLASLAARKQDYRKALDFAKQSLIRNWYDLKVRHLIAALLRKLSESEESFINDSVQIDPLYLGLLYEKAVGSESIADMDNWLSSARNNVNNFLEIAILYCHAGMYDDAIDVLAHYRGSHPLISYYGAYAYQKIGETSKALEQIEEAESQSPDYCFPNKLIEILILNSAIDLMQQAPMAHYYLGNLYYDKKQYKLARNHWEAAVEQKNDLAVAHRNLSIVYFNKLKNPDKAMEEIKKACSLDEAYPRYWLEYDQLAARMDVSKEERLAVMEPRLDIVRSRDVYYLRYITLLNDVGQYDEALEALESHTFHPWEGGEGKVSSEYRRSLISLAQKCLSNDHASEAIELLRRGISFPENLGEGKLPNVPDNEIYYYLAKAHELMGDADQAADFYQNATAGSQIPEKALYYHDQPSDYIFYQGLAFTELGQIEAALKSFHQLIIFGERHIFDEAEDDYFAVSLPQIEVYEEDIQQNNTDYCNRLRKLGEAGLEILNERGFHQNKDY